MESSSIIQAHPLVRPEPKRKPMVEERDGIRETLETIAFVVSLVLMLKAFVAEAFVIPTGSMATTLLGDHNHVTCDRCRYPFLVNNQINTQRRAPGRAICPNCQQEIHIGAPIPDGGDKVLVLKPQYDFWKPERHDTIVFKYPGDPYYLTHAGFMQPDSGDKRTGGPQEDFGPKNFIKRLWGLPGEKLAIHFGDVHLVVPDGQGGERLQIIQRKPDVLMVMRRIVNDNDFQAPHAKPPIHSRWHAGVECLDGAEASAWRAVQDNKVFISQPKPAPQWLRYQHILQSAGPFARERGAMPEVQPLNVHPQLITDFLDYNGGDQAHHYVGDLMLDCKVKPLKHEGKLILEIRSGIDCYRAILHLESQECELMLIRRGESIPLEAAKQRVEMSTGILHRVRFAAFDQKLTVWLDKSLVFGDGVLLPPLPAQERGPRLADLFPVSIGAEQAEVEVSQLQVWRDTYFTRTSHTDVDVSEGGLNLSYDEIKKRIQVQLAAVKPPGSGPLSSQEWALHQLRAPEWAAYYPSGVVVGDRVGFMKPPEFYPKQDPRWHPSDRFGPDEYFALGDNSVASKDSRYWGQVYHRLLLGKAVCVYWPWERWILIR